MLIPLDELVKKHKMKIRGVIHLGAHLGEEAPIYKKLRIKNVLWVEGDEDKARELREMGLPDGHSVITAIVGDTMREVEFNIANNGQSSSVLKFGLHRRYHPEVEFIRTEKRKMVPLDTIMDVMHRRSDPVPPTDEAMQAEELRVKNAILQDRKRYNFLNLDLQGAELLALKGATNTLQHIDYVYTEVNDANVYDHCALIGEIDAFLSDFGFKRTDTEMTHAHWGDALYIKG